MADDERLARELQRQFDAEERQRRADEAASERLAQRLAAGSHTMSDSGDSDDAGDGQRDSVRLYSMSEDSGDGAEARLGSTTRPAARVASPRYSMSGDSDDGRDLTRTRVSQFGGARGGPLRVPDRCGEKAGKRPLSPAVKTAASPRHGVTENSGVAADGEEVKRRKRRRLPATVSGGASPADSGTPSRTGNGQGSGRVPGAGARTGDGTGTGRTTETKDGGGRPDPATAATQPSSNGSVRPSQSQCRYGARCYRRGNPAHTQAFSHPEQPAERPQPAVDVLPSASATDGGATAQKRPGHKTSIAGRLREAEPISFFLTKVRSVKSTWRERLSLGIVELLDPSLGELKSSLQLNFMVDLDWLLEAYSVYGHQHKPLTVLHGMDPFSSPQSHITVQKVSMPYPFGTHHTKMMLFEYAEGMRVVIHTSNLVDDDWGDKTQGMWVSPLLPPVNGAATDGDAPTGFRADLTRYLSAYKLRCLAPWLEKVARHDFSAIRVFFVGSVPGRFQGADMALWGHFRVRRLLQKHATRKNWDLVIQCSSIGRLGTVPEQWLLGEFRESLTGGTSSARAAVVYPTEENVRTSVEGYDGGSCLPYHHKTHVQQLWLRENLHQWRSESRGRTGAMPHIKTYTQLSADQKRMAWFMVTSANLSKAAWGATEKQGQQLFIRSYEAGVLYVPKMLDCEFLTALTGDTAVPGCLSLPYSLPLLPYGDGDKPWFADTAHPRPDPMGRMLVKT